MKANQFGTHSEQVLFRMGYKTSKERPQCGNCKQGETTFNNPGSSYETARYRCKKADCGVTQTAICNDWEKK